jgi:hypothetical protein
MLAQWLPEALRANRRTATSNSGLNIASPLDHEKKGPRDWVDPSTSADPLLIAYIEQGDRKNGVAPHVAQAVENSTVATEVRGGFGGRTRDQYTRNRKGRARHEA